jgi:hypothetical protein
MPSSEGRLLSVVGVWMPFEYDKVTDAPHAAVTPVTSPPIASSEEGARDSTAAFRAETRGDRLPPRRPGRQASAVVAGALALTVLTLVLVLADVGQTTAGQPGPVAKHPTATPRSTATATATVFPTPTPMSGFQVYVDRSEGFLVQYPLTWTRQSNNPEVVFLDNANNTSYQVQLDLPGDATSIGLQGDPNVPSAWVNYAMNELSAQFGDGFQQLPGPTPAAIIGGEQWQSSVALLSISGVSVRVQVYATVHNGKPYILSLEAADERFDTGRQLYFGPMLGSFQFLPSLP